MVKSSGCSYRGSGFCSQHLHGGSELSVPPVPGDPTPPSHLHGHQAHTWRADVHSGKAFIHITYSKRKYAPEDRFESLEVHDI